MFWKTYPLFSIIESKLNSKVFKSQIINRPTLNKSPTGVCATILNSKNTSYTSSDISDIRKFIQNNFGSPPSTPVLDIPEKYLLGEKDHLIIVKDIDRTIIGCIRYHYLGIFTSSKNEEIYCVDCFTVHNKWRRKGVGDYMLFTLHHYANMNNIPYCMFLKEGTPLTTIHRPLYTGIYVFRELLNNWSSSVKDLTPHNAYKIIDILREMNSKILIIRNIKSDNQQWKIYKNNATSTNAKSIILACFQDTFQRFTENGKIKKIGWCTGWIESAGITDKCREEASKELSASMYSQFDFVWMNKEWIGNPNNDTWKPDGIFNWYTYQWTTSISLNKSYCIMN
jgi:hypothetical protein